MRVRVRFSVPIAAMGLLASGAAAADEASLTGIWKGIQAAPGALNYAGVSSLMDRNGVLERRRRGDRDRAVGGSVRLAVRRGSAAAAAVVEVACQLTSRRWLKQFGGAYGLRRTLLKPTTQKAQDVDAHETGDGPRCRGGPAPDRSAEAKAAAARSMSTKRNDGSPAGEVRPLIDGNRSKGAPTGAQEPAVASLDAAPFVNANSHAESLLSLSEKAKLRLPDLDALRNDRDGIRTTLGLSFVASSLPPMGGSYCRWIKRKCWSPVKGWSMLPADSQRPTVRQSGRRRGYDQSYSP